MCKHCVYSFYYCWTGDGLTGPCKIFQEREEGEELILDENRREKEGGKDEKTSDEKGKTDKCWKKEEGVMERRPQPQLQSIILFFIMT